MTPVAAPPPGLPKETMLVGEAARIIGKSDRQIGRWVDKNILRGGRAKDPITGKEIEGSWRWVDAAHVVLLAVGANRTHLVPEHWQHLIPQQMRVHQRRARRAS